MPTPRLLLSFINFKKFQLSLRQERSCNNSNTIVWKCNIENITSNDGQPHSEHGFCNNGGTGSLQSCLLWWKGGREGRESSRLRLTDRHGSRLLSDYKVIKWDVKWVYVVNCFLAFPHLNFGCSAMLPKQAGKSMRNMLTNIILHMMSTQLVHPTCPAILTCPQTQTLKRQSSSRSRRDHATSPSLSQDAARALGDGCENAPLSPSLHLFSLERRKLWRRVRLS